MRGLLSFVVLATAWTLVTSASAALAGPTIEVPEPSSMALLAVGLGGAAWVKFRRRK
jgi:hypothetical protein